jgi:hypothetical protein
MSVSNYDLRVTGDGLMKEELEQLNWKNNLM